MKNAEISRRILALVAQGVEIRAAVNAVLGAGTFEKIAADVYDALRAAR